MLWQSNTPLSPQPNEGTQLPATFGDTFDAAWREGLLSSSLIRQSNARIAALDGYVDEVRQTSGQDIGAAVGSDLQFPQLRMEAVQNAVSKLKQDRPGLQILDLTDDELDRRAASIAGLSHDAFAEMSGREKTFGGKLGMLVGGLLAGAGDPLNLIFAPVPEAKLGIVATAALWSGFGAGSQAINEIANAQFQEMATPGYAASGAAAKNIAEAAAGGAVLGGLFKGVSAVWSRMKTGEWPRSVRDAGNIVESEANIQGSNVLPGVEGVAAHREALGKAIDDIVAGKPVEVPERVGGLMQESARLEEPAPLLPTEAKPNIVSPYEAPDLGGAVPSPAREPVSQTILRQPDADTDTKPYSGLLHSKVFDAALEWGERYRARALARGFDPDLAEGIFPTASSGDMTLTKTRQSGYGGAEITVSDPEGQSIAKLLVRHHEGDGNIEITNFEALSGGDTPIGSLGNRKIADIRRALGSLYPDATTISGFHVTGAKAGSGAESRVVIRRGQTDFEALLSHDAAVSPLTPAAIQQTLADPAHATGLMADLERIRDTGTKPQMVAVGTDAANEPQYQLLDAAIQEAKDYENAASQIESCINPPAEEP